MCKSSEYEMFRQLADSVRNMKDAEQFYQELDLALEYCALTEEEYNELKSMAEKSAIGGIRYVSWASSTEFELLSTADDTEQSSVFRQCMVFDEVGQRFVDLCSFVSRITGVQFKFLIGKSRNGMAMSLHHEMWRKGSIVFAEQVSESSMEVVLCNYDTQAFCSEYKISTLHAKDVLKDFLAIAEPMFKKSGLNELMLFGTELSVDRHIELLGFTHVGYTVNKVEVWKKSL